MSQRDTSAEVFLVSSLSLLIVSDYCYFLIYVYEKVSNVQFILVAKYRKHLMTDLKKKKKKN